MSRGLSSWLVDGHLPAMSSHGLSSVCASLVYLCASKFLLLTRTLVSLV